MGSSGQQESISRLSEFLQDAPKYEGVVYRGLGFGRQAEKTKFLNSLKDNEIVHFKGFTSTSVERRVAYDFSKVSRETVILEIHSKRGVWLNGLSLVQKEKEVLFDKDSVFKVQKIFKEDELNRVPTKIILTEVLK